MLTKPAALKITKALCPFCKGTGAVNPDAEHSMDWRDYLPCLACLGTGHVLAKKKEERERLA